MSTVAAKTIVRSAAPGRGHAVACLVASIACAGLTVTAAGCGSNTGPAPPQQPAARFQDAYVMPDGRVARINQGGDTVSEGQAYGMLLAEAAGNYDTFAQIWKWTRDHLQLGDGLFAWHANVAGKIISDQPASDADLLIAWALLRYRGPRAATLHRNGSQVAKAILAHEVTTGPGATPILAAGPWATGRPASLNPSYWSLPAFQDLARLTGDQMWHRLAVGAVTTVSDLTRNGQLLPPDWAELTASGVLRPEPAPDGSQPQTQYGPDAQRTVVWFAASCDPRARKLAARWWLLLRRGDHGQALALHPAGTVLDPSPEVLPMVASAAAAKVAGDGAVAQRLLQRARAHQQAHPTYYGGAWDALGQALLRSSALSTC